MPGEIIKEVGTDQINFYLSLFPPLEETSLKVEVVREDFERAFFCVKRALTHLKFRNHPFRPLECDGCKEAALFITQPGYRGDEHNPVGVDFERPY